MSGSAVVDVRSGLEDPHELLGVERVPACPRDERLLRLGVEERPIEQREDEAGGVLVRKRREGDGRRVALASSPARSAVEELGPGGAQDQQRDAVHPIDEVVDEVEQAFVGPVQILEHEHRGPALGERLDEPPPSGERFATLVARQVVASETDERPEVSRHPRALALVG